MSALNRKMFNRGGQVSSRGVGITSGLDTPKRGYVDRPGSYQGNGEATLPTRMDNITADTQAYYDLLKQYTPEREPFNRFQANVEPLLTLFGNLMSGTSYQGGLGGALEIAGKGLKEAAPGFQRAINERRAYEASDPDAALRAQALGLAIENQPDPEVEKWTGKESFKANVNVAPVEEGGEGSTVVRQLTRFTSNLGNVEYRDQNNNVIGRPGDIIRVKTENGGEKIYMWGVANDWIGY